MHVNSFIAFSRIVTLESRPRCWLDDPLVRTLLVRSKCAGLDVLKEGGLGLPLIKYRVPVIKLVRVVGRLRSLASS